MHISMLSTALPRAGGTRVEVPLRIAEVVATVKSRIQEMSRESLYRMRQVHELTGWIYSRNRFHVKLIESVRFLI